MRESPPRARRRRRYSQARLEGKQTPSRCLAQKETSRISRAKSKQSGASPGGAGHEIRSVSVTRGGPEHNPSLPRSRERTSACNVSSLVRVHQGHAIWAMERALTGNGGPQQEVLRRAEHDEEEHERDAEHCLAGLLEAAVQAGQRHGQDCRAETRGVGSGGRGLLRPG